MTYSQIMQASWLW